MKKLILLLAFFTFSFSFSQNNIKDTNKIVTKAITAYNTSNFDAIYNLYAPEYKKEKSKDVVIAHFKRIKNAFGLITKSNEKALLKKGLLRYKLDSKSLSELVISTNKNNEITLLSINR